VRVLAARRYFFSAAAQNFDAWRKDGAKPKDPHPSLRAGLSPRGEANPGTCTRKSTVSLSGRGLRQPPDVRTQNYLRFRVKRALLLNDSKLIEESRTQKGLVFRFCGYRATNRSMKPGRVDVLALIGWYLMAPYRPSSSSRLPHNGYPSAIFDSTAEYKVP
jgi:hypothetical protein